MPSTLYKYYSHLNASKRESQRKRIYAWEKDRVHIEEMAASASTAVLKSDMKKGRATTISTEGEEGLIEWVNSLRGECSCIEAIEETVTESDDVVTHLIDESTEEK
ncbi:hypothetical protein PC129_g14012 [Phytophthora cactorum]|uniref:HTH CENPB-type domain-containing protein n=1 Tax=Phytophthora cactorum TaxID=29920 RepID=A0A329S0C3_9STRA|nr:hypothetical protein Pcac1_g4744 [Phytophthora cactorum]KAG2811079.1 hypothetical protein PC112_g15778 [Phytophthora cactorum]KAG2812507.1 hypothetical protein PC111_g14787 [Phytophthora cactorum]KAG2851497.1 hypothetical protein PC113_g15864 [Phytophthora cactorum]KAG2890593.1 hypothetical protein PC114_g17375 [Phytophthora cactorum]